MTVIVVEPGARNRQSGVAGGNECRLLLRRTVVGNLEDVGLEIHPSAHDRLLARRFHIAGEEQTQARGLHHDHQAAVILL